MTQSDVDLINKIDRLHHNTGTIKPTIEKNNRRSSGKLLGANKQHQQKLAGIRNLAALTPNDRKAKREERKAARTAAKDTSSDAKLNEKRIQFQQLKQNRAERVAARENRTLAGDLKPRGEKGRKTRFGPKTTTVPISVL